MALPVGHAAAGYLAYEAVRPAGRHRAGWLATALLLANAPDLDYLPGLLVGHPDAWHRGVTHSLAAALAVAAGVTALAAARRLPGRLALGAALAWASHLLLDFVTQNALPPRGIPLFSPWSARTFVGPGSARVWLEQAALLVCAVAAVHAARALAAMRAAPVREMARDDG